MLRAWHEDYREHGLTILGVHTPEFGFEKQIKNVREAAAENDLEHLIVQDNDYSTWRSFNNRYWPAKYIFDPDGFLRFAHFGEGKYAETEHVIRLLLTEAGHDVSGIEPTFVLEQ